MFDQISNRTWTIFGAVVTVVLGGALLVACGIFVYFFVPDAFEQSPTHRGGRDDALSFGYDNGTTHSDAPADE